MHITEYMSGTVAISTTLKKHHCTITKFRKKLLTTIGFTFYEDQLLLES